VSTMNIVLVALVDPTGAVLLRLNGDQSTTRPRRASLPGGMIKAGESPEQAAVRLVSGQTGLEVTGLRRAFSGLLPDRPVAVTLLAAPTTARNSDIVVHGAYIAGFVPGEDVLSGRAFTTATGFVLNVFMNSLLYQALAPRPDLTDLA
jgi:8-oxo-dGTP pyrophosphatase MutT (NUDIX family)